MSARQRLHLVVPLVAIAAIFLQAALVVSSPRPDTISDPRPLPATIKGLVTPTHNEYDEIVDELEDSGDGITATQSVNSAGVTRDRLWAYVTTTAPAGGKRIAHYLLQRDDTKVYSNWTLISYWSGGEHYRRCTRAVPRELQTLLVRDRIRCQ